MPASSAERINIDVSAVTFDDVAAGTEATVQFRLTNDLTQGLFGVLATELRFALAQLSPAPGGSGESSAWQAYVTRDDAGATQATTERGTAGTLVDNNDGSYTYTFELALPAYPDGPTYDPTKTHRLGIEIRGQVPIRNNGIYDFVPDGNPISFTRLIVDNDTCNACHDRLEFHGGPRTDVEYCVTCHNPFSTDGGSGNSVDMKRLIHNIHAGRDGFVIDRGSRGVEDFSDVRWTQDPRNCQTCHQENDTDTPQASNWRLVPNRQACGTCHYDDGLANGINEYAIEDGVHPGGFIFTDDTQCVDCHGPNGTVTNSRGQLVRVDEIHRIPGLEASGNFVFAIVEIRNAVSNGFIEVDYSVADATGALYDLDTAPEFTACADGTSRLAIDIGWDISSPDDDFTNQPRSNASPISLNALGAGCGGLGTDADGDNVFTLVSTTALPAGLSGSVAVALEGHPGSDLDGDGNIAGRGDRVAVTTAIAYAGIDGATATERRSAVNIANCDDCHKQLSLHGNNRTDKPEVCVICHNPNATDINRRVAGSDCVNDLGTDDQAIDFKNMIHGIHAGNIGVCGFGNSSHPYFDVKYPGQLNNCEGCHTDDSFYPREAGTILGTTIDANDPATPTDDVVVSPNTSVCSACHTSSMAAEHMKQNGGTFTATKAADGTLLPADVETCALCHGPGRTADVAEMHGVGEFEFNR